MRDCSSGPVSSMPGSLSAVLKGEMCGVHHTTPAVKRVQGETDSFGCEYAFMCQVCLDAYSEHQAVLLEEERFCDWCKTLTKGCAPTRDYDEGMSGPIYNVCPECRRKDAEAAQAEYDEYYHNRCLGVFYE